MAEILSYSVNQFCKTIPISRATLYEQWRSGQGPKCFFIGKRRFISQEAAREWIKTLEGASHA